MTDTEPLKLYAGRWWHMDGEPGEVDLLIRIEGRPLAASDPTRAVVSGWRLVGGGNGDPGEVWVTVQVPVDRMARGRPVLHGPARRVRRRHGATGRPAAAGRTGAASPGTTVRRDGNLPMVTR